MISVARKALEAVGEETFASEEPPDDLFFRDYNKRRLLLRGAAQGFGNQLGLSPLYSPFVLPGRMHLIKAGFAPEVKTSPFPCAAAVPLQGWLIKTSLGLRAPRAGASRR